MYMFKKDVVNVFNQSAIAREIDVAIETVNRIFNRKQSCSKRTAQCICQSINKNAKIEDYFEKVKKGE